MELLVDKLAVRPVPQPFVPVLPNVYMQDARHTVPAIDRDRLFRPLGVALVLKSGEQDKKEEKVEEEEEEVTKAQVDPATSVAPSGYEPSPRPAVNEAKEGNEAKEFVSGLVWVNNDAEVFTTLQQLDGVVGFVTRRNEHEVHTALTEAIEKQYPLEADRWEFVTSHAEAMETWSAEYGFPVEHGGAFFLRQQQQQQQQQQGGKKPFDAPTRQRLRQQLQHAVRNKYRVMGFEALLTSSSFPLACNTMVVEDVDMFLRSRLEQEQEQQKQEEKESIGPVLALTRRCPVPRDVDDMAALFNLLLGTWTQYTFLRQEQQQKQSKETEDNFVLAQRWVVQRTGDRVVVTEGVLPVSKKGKKGKISEPKDELVQALHDIGIKVQGDPQVTSVLPFGPDLDVVKKLPSLRRVLQQVFFKKTFTDHHQEEKSCAVHIETVPLTPCQTKEKQDDDDAWRRTALFTWPASHRRPVFKDGDKEGEEKEEKEEKEEVLEDALTTLAHQGFLKLPLLQEHGPKLAVLLESLSLPGIHVVTSSLEGVDGLGLVETMLLQAGYSKYDLLEDGVFGQKGKPRFVRILDSEVKEKENKTLLDIVNNDWTGLDPGVRNRVALLHDSNVYGHVAQVVLVPWSYVQQNQRLRNVRHVHVLDAAVHPAEWMQWESMVTWHGSHTDLLSDERSVMFRVYLSSSSSSSSSLVKTIDEIDWDKLQQGKSRLQQVLGTLFS